MTRVIKSLNKKYLQFAERLEKYLLVLVIAFFICGILLARSWATAGDIVSNLMDGFIGAYDYIAPFAIFIIITPAIAKLLKSDSGRFGAYTVRWILVRSLFATIFAVILTVILFGFPLLPQGNVSVVASFRETSATMIKMFYTSPFLLAIWFGFIIAYISTKVNWLYTTLSHLSDGFELTGQYLIPLIPLFMLAVGAYIYYLPTNINAGLASQGFTFSTLNIFGLSIDANTAGGMIKMYFFAGIISGIMCFGWHFILLSYVKLKCNCFSIKDYFKNYWIRVYPLLWATSSEALATPLNLYLTKEHFPYVKKVVRRFVVGMGSYLNINGTLICVVVMGGVVSAMLGLSPSLLEWMFAVPIIFLLGFAVPGIPGELVLFAGPLATLLGLEPEMAGIFIALYVGLQLGLQDSFRTGSNSTDDCLSAVLLNQVYEEKFLKDVYDKVEDMLDDEDFNKLMEKGLNNERMALIVGADAFKKELKHNLGKINRNRANGEGLI